jgi:beta-lactamase class A
MATPIQAPRSSRYNSTALVPDQALSTLVANRIARLSGRVGVAIKDLDTGRGTLIDPDGEYQMASLFKLTVMYEVYKQRDLGALSFDETLVFTQRYVDYDLGTLDRPVGSTIQLGEALQRMIEISDNSSAVLLTDRVGSNNINQDLRALGLTHTRLFNDDLVTSPADMLSFMEMIARGEGLSPSTSAEMVRLLARQRVNDRIPRLLPDGITVAHKTGNLPGVVNDVGIVYEPGATYVVALLVDGTSDDGAATQAEAQVARDAYDYFQSLHNGAVTTFPTAAPTNTPRPVTPVPPTAIPLSPTQTPLPATEEPPTATLTATLALPTAVPGSPTTAPPTVVPTAVALSSPVPTATTAATPIAPVTSVPTALSNGTTAAVLAPARTPSAEPTTATIRQ